MKIINKLKRIIIYHITEKPKTYLHIDKPKTFQDYRQIQYNNWCTWYKVYCGSYLPKNRKHLLKKGFIRVFDNYLKNGEKYKRKSDGQIIRYDFEVYDKKYKPAHYHWLKDDQFYYDKYGNSCRYLKISKCDFEHHIAPYDEDYKIYERRMKHDKFR